MSKRNNNNSQVPSKNTSILSCNIETCQNLPQLRVNNQPLEDDYFTPPQRNYNQSQVPLEKSLLFCDTNTCQNIPPRRGHNQRLEEDNITFPQSSRNQNPNLLSVPEESPDQLSDFSPPEYVPKGNENNIPELRVNYELVEDEAYSVSPTASIRHPPQNQNPKFLTVPLRNPNQMSDLTPPNFPIYRDNRISNQTSKTNYSREFRSRIPKRTSTPKIFPSAEERTNSFIINAKNDSINMLSVAISTIMLLASDNEIPDNYRLCTTKYLQLIRNNCAQSPPNVKKILKLLQPSHFVTEPQPMTQRGGVNCSCPKKVIVSRYKN